MDNARFSKKLIENYAEILKAWPHYEQLRSLFQEKLLQINQQKPINKVIEIGPGYGESTKYILNLPLSNLTFVDIDKYLIDRLRDNLKTCCNTFPAPKLSFVLQDANKYLNKLSAQNFDLVTASWTIHNFTQKEKIIFLQNAKKILARNGFLVLLDKFYPNSGSKKNNLFVNQLHKINKLSIPKTVKQELIMHELEDISKLYLMQHHFKHIITSLGFKTLFFHSINQDALLVAKKR